MSKQDKREQILNAAEKVFAELGYEGASTRFLASEAGVNMAMINYYFGSKDGLLKAVLERRISSMGHALREVQVQNLPADEKLRRLLEVYLSRVSLDNSFHRIIHREISLMQRSEMSDFISESVVANTNVMVAAIEEGISQGIFRQVDVNLSIAGILGTIYYIVNSSQVSSRLLNADYQDPEVMETQIRPRIKKYLNEYIDVFLKNDDAQN